MDALITPVAFLPIASDVPNPIVLLLADKRSPATKRAYAADLSDFFGPAADPAAVQNFLSLAPPALALRLAEYKGQLLRRGLSEATINRRLAALRSLLKFSHRLGLTGHDGRGLVDGEKVRGYRDTRGLDVKGVKRLLALPASAHGADTERGLRDTALLRLLVENALRRAEVCALDVSDFSLTERRLHIIGKGRGTQKQPVTLTQKSTNAVAAYLVGAGHAEDEGGPLFRNLDRRQAKTLRGFKFGERLTPEGLYWLIGDYGKRMGVTLTPHKLRHSAITAALDATGGDVRRVQRLSRHADLRTLQIYDDNRQDFQGEVSSLLSDLF